MLDIILIYNFGRKDSTFSYTQKMFLHFFCAKMYDNECIRSFNSLKNR